MVESNREHSSRMRLRWNYNRKTASILQICNASFLRSRHERSACTSWKTRRWKSARRVIWSWPWTSSIIQSEPRWGRSIHESRKFCSKHPSLNVRWAMPSNQVIWRTKLTIFILDTPISSKLFSLDSRGPVRIISYWSSVTTGGNRGPVRIISYWSSVTTRGNLN